LSLGELRAEYEMPAAQGGIIGPKILNEVTRAVGILTKRYDPQIYAGVADWRDGVDDVVQGVVTDLLLGEGQLDYIFGQATTLDDFRGLLFFQTKRFLARGRRRTVIDNLLDRCKDILAQPPFESIAGRPIRYSLGQDPEDCQPSDSELVAAATYSRGVPRITYNASERAPIVYSRENLTKLLVIVGHNLRCPFSVRHLHLVLESLLTDWIPSFLEEVEEVPVPTAELGPDDEVQVNAARDLILAELTAEEAVILRAQILRIPDQAVADELETSRQTVITRKQRLFQRLQPALSGLSEDLQVRVIEQVGMDLTLPDQGPGV